jgi:hypothetical protein
VRQLAVPGSFRFRVGLSATVGGPLIPQKNRIALAMWLKRLFGRREKESPSGRAPGTKETEQGREDRQKDFLGEHVRQRDEDESHMQDKGP